MSADSNTASVALPHWLAQQAALTPSAKLVYGRLFVVAADIDFDWFFPNLEHLGSSIGMTKGQFVFHLSALKRLRLVEEVSCLHPDGRVVKAIHLVGDHPWFKDVAPPQNPIRFEARPAFPEPVRASHLKLVP